MRMIQIRLFGNVAFENRMKMTEGFRYDIPVNHLGIPFMPLAALLPAEIAGDISLGYAFPEGYDGLVDAADHMMQIMPDIAPQIRSVFTGERYYPDEGYWVRYLKAGQTFYAMVYGEADLKALSGALQTVERIGIQREGISGEVKCSLLERKPAQSMPKYLSDDLKYERLTYTVTSITPLCLHSPYAEGVRTMTYIPGGILRNELEKQPDLHLQEMSGSFRFSNAYIRDGYSRLLPTPLCMALVKLDKIKLHYRLAPGNDPARVEQDVSLGDAYTHSFENFMTVYTRPETERITSRNGNMYDALCAGQAFGGTIYGEDKSLRELAQYLQDHPFMHLGSLSEEGFGEVYIRVEQLEMKKIEAEHLVRSFDVSCLAPALILNGAGMPDTSAEGFLAELERVWGQPGKLKIVDQYMDVYMDSAFDAGWGQDGAVVRCLAKGSVMRLASKDGSPLDISPILHTFIGERTKDGYGEIMAYPALGDYYRTARQVSPEKYNVKYPASRRTLQLTVDLTSQVLEMLLKRNIQYLAVMDRGDHRKGEDASSLIPMELLRAIRDRYKASVSDGVLEQWYLEGLEEDEDAIFSV